MKYCLENMYIDPSITTKEQKLDDEGKTIRHKNYYHRMYYPKAIAQKQ